MYGLQVFWLKSLCLRFICVYDVGMTTTTITYTINNETREITFEISKYDATCASNYDDFVVRVGRGTKAHKTQIEANLVNGIWIGQNKGYALNGMHNISGFRDKVQTNALSQHNGSTWIGGE